MVKVLDFIIYWCIILIPFFVAIAPAPANIFMGLMIAAFLAKKIIKKEPLIIKTAINLPLLFLFIITCVSLVHSINYRDSFKGGIGRLAYDIFVVLIMASEIKERKHLIKIAAALFAGVALVSIDAIWQVYSGKDFIRGYGTIANLGLVRATASFKDANTFGVYLSAIAPLIFGLTLFYFKMPKKIFHLFLSALALLGIALTYSRPTLLAIYLIFIFFAIVKKKKVMLGGLIVLAIIAPFFLPNSVKDWAKEVDYNPVRFMCNDDRIAIFRNSANMVKAHPIIGVGANTFMKNYKKYKENPEYRGIVTSDYLYAHNNFLHMTAEIGFLGLFIFIWLLFNLFKEAAKIYKSLQDPYVKELSLVLIACLISFLINGLTESSLYYSRVAIIFWYLIGLLLSLKKFAICPAK
ncbi:MAG: O-antigen ligase family protein [Candidatus Omnitrophica bacterium]|jgi:O-antigen ligase|nr:O-antigen ligase family protein [Candidatus Omnitrophota bacterium]